MSIVRALGRMCLSSVLIVGGLDAARNPKSKVPMARGVVEPLVEKVDALSSVEQVVQLDGYLKVGAGATMALGILPRVSALALATSLAATTVAGHAFWKIDDPEARATNRLHFLKNLSAIGGLLVVAGQPRQA